MPDPDDNVIAIPTGKGTPYCHTVTEPAPPPNRRTAEGKNREQIAEMVESHYSIGRVIGVREIFGGYNNRSYRILVDCGGHEKKYFVREYTRQPGDEGIRFEHRLISHAIENGLSGIAGTIVNRRGETFTRWAGNNAIYALYEYLGGEDRYTWDNPDLTDREFQSAAQRLADYHNAMRNFDPGGLNRGEPPIRELWRELPERLRRLARKTGSGRYTDYFRQQLETILATVAKITPPPGEHPYMPVLPAHYDYHPGNLKWEGETATGIFDFDWSKMDLRLFDVCMALIYFCGCWDSHRDGELRMSKVALFLNSYQKRLAVKELIPITSTERALIPEMLAMSNLYLLHWGVNHFYGPEESNEKEYLRYLQHGVRLMRWIEQNNETIAATAVTALKRAEPGG